ncbi:uncharacterized protein LOC131648729 [Vicia villosa]|uniref:uncharacterized protein LOC131648729 n=1 Tax=Vicia villosa TaxID=3911 RepID=UPI00273CA374|nr:uncharacterized protein LOC131648729 [Vicia villosa]
MNQSVYTNELIKQLANKVDAIASRNKMLGTQILQVAQQQATTTAPTGIFPSQPQPNPKGHANAIILRSRKNLDGPVKETIEKEQSCAPPPPYKPLIPFPQRLAKSKTERQFKKFVELLKQLHITIHFLEAITQMPSYSKFLKEILSNKRKVNDGSTVTLTKECIVIIHNKMLPKLKDPGSFFIPCVVGNFVIDKALCDLGASVSLTALLICERLNLGSLKTTRMSLQLADRSVKYLVGIVDDVLLRISHLYIPTDLVVMEIKEDSNIPILLGRPFLTIIGVIIDVKQGKLTFEVGEEKIEYILS